MQQKHRKTPLETIQRQFNARASFAPRRMRRSASWRSPDQGLLVYIDHMIPGELFDVREVDVRAQG